MKVIQLSRLERVHLVRRKKQASKRTATERLRDYMYHKHAPRLLVSESEAQQRRMWKKVADGS